MYRYGWFIETNEAGKLLFELKKEEETCLAQIYSSSMCRRMAFDRKWAFAAPNSKRLA